MYVALSIDFVQHTANDPCKTKQQQWWFFISEYDTGWLGTEEEYRQRV